MTELDQKLIENLTKSIEGLTKTVKKSQQQSELLTKRQQRQTSGRAPARPTYNTTRFTTPDIGGFRAFFSRALGEELIEDVEQFGFKEAIGSRFGRAVGAPQARAIERQKEQARARWAEATEEWKAAQVAFEAGNMMLEQFEMSRERFRAAQAERQRAKDITERMEGGLALRRLRNLAIGFGIATAAVLKFRESIIEAGQALGGVDISQALRNRIDSIFTSIASLFTGQFVGFGQIERIQGSIAGEFGRLINTDEALRIGRVQQRLGITIDEFTKLQRALQGTGMDVEETVDEFREIGIVGRVAAQEVAKNADAVARAGDQFNKFIRDGVANARRLGLEFGEIESTLMNISTDFEGTVGSFSSLRAVLPGFAADFGQLFTTALYGTTDEFIDQIRNSLQGAGVTDISQLNRTQVAMLEQATGFGAAELQRILENEEVFQDEALTLDRQRNSLLNKLGIVLTTGLGALIGATIGSSIMGLITGTALAGSGAIIGGLAGAGAGLFGGAAMTGGFNDFVFRPGQPPAKFSSEDTIIGTKEPEKVMGRSATVDNSALESKLDRLIAATEAQTNTLNRGLLVEMRGLDKAIIQKREAVIRNS